MKIHVVTLWVMTPCSLVECSQRFTETRCLQLQGMSRRHNPQDGNLTLELQTIPRQKCRSYPQRLSWLEAYPTFGHQSKILGFFLFPGARLA
jgi:hypothetical protein